MVPAAFAIALVLSLALTPLVVRFAWAIGYLDHPEARKLHTSAMPLLGGAGVFVCALAAWAIAERTAAVAPGAGAALALGGAALALVVGLVDDRFGMRPSVKMLGQALAATLLVTGAGVPALGPPAVVSGAIAVVALIALMNAVNFLDNMNGMVSGLAAITLAAFATLSLARGAAALAAAQLALAGACAGFLPHNFPKARIFLGDAGSLLLGYALGASALIAFNAQPLGWGRVGPVLMLGYPAFDLVFAVVTRVRDGHPVYEGGKDHTNHRLATLVGPAGRTVPVVWLTGAALCASGLAVARLDAALPALAIAGSWLLVLAAAGVRLAAVPVVRRG